MNSKAVTWIIIGLLLGLAPLGAYQQIGPLAFLYNMIRAGGFTGYFAHGVAILFSVVGVGMIFQALVLLMRKESKEEEEL